jgi:hypothetical protein
LWKQLRTVSWGDKHKRDFRAVRQELVLRDPSESVRVSHNGKKEVNEIIKEREKIPS